MAPRELPLHFHALRVDPATPISERTAELLHRDLQRWTRRYVRPFARLISLTAVWVIVALKRLLPFQFSWHSMLDRLSVWFLRHCVSREGGELLLRHFIVETLLIRFVARNSGLQDVPEPDLMPTTFKGLMGHAVIQHDINMYRLIIDAGEKLRASGRRVSVLWQHDDTLAFVARGREYRSEFHINPSDETMYMIKGEMRLHSRTPEGKERIDLIPAGSIIYTPAGTPHSPRFPPDAFALISERKRRAGEIDKFHWYCPKCDTLLHEEQFIVNDYDQDPVSKAYQRFFESLEFRTCKHCGGVMPAPDAL